MQNISGLKMEVLTAFIYQGFGSQPSKVSFDLLINYTRVCLYTKSLCIGRAIPNPKDFNLE